MEEHLDQKWMSEHEMEGWKLICWSSSHNMGGINAWCIIWLCPLMQWVSWCPQELCFTIIFNFQSAVWVSENWGSGGGFTLAFCRHPFREERWTRLHRISMPMLQVQFVGRRFESISRSAECYSWVIVVPKAMTTYETYQLPSYQDEPVQAGFNCYILYEIGNIFFYSDTC